MTTLETRLPSSLGMIPNVKIDVTYPHNGVQACFLFENGYGASMIRHDYSLGNRAGLFEIAVLDRDDNICIDTPVASDVIGHLDTEAAMKILLEIQALPEAPDKKGPFNPWTPDAFTQAALEWRAGL